MLVLQLDVDHLVFVVLFLKHFLLEVLVWPSIFVAVEGYENRAFGCTLHRNS